MKGYVLKKVAKKREVKPFFSTNEIDNELDERCKGKSPVRTYYSQQVVHVLTTESFLFFLLWTYIQGADNSQ